MTTIKDIVATLTTQNVVLSLVVTNHNPRNVAVLWRVTYNCLLNVFCSRMETTFHLGRHWDFAGAHDRTHTREPAYPLHGMQWVGQNKYAANRASWCQKHTYAHRVGWNRGGATSDAFSCCRVGVRVANQSQIADVTLPASRGPASCPEKRVNLT